MSWGGGRGGGGSGGGGEEEKERTVAGNQAKKNERIWGIWGIRGRATQFLLQYQPIKTLHPLTHTVHIFYKP